MRAMIKAQENIPPKTFCCDELKALASTKERKEIDIDWPAIKARATCRFCGKISIKKYFYSSTLKSYIHVSCVDLDEGQGVPL